MMTLQDISALTAIVPPPAAPLQTGGPDEWKAAQAAIDIFLPDSLAAISMRYGSGHFEESGFLLRIFNVFSPLFVDRCKYLRAIRTDAGYQQSGDSWAIFLRDKFEFGEWTWSHEDREHHLMWDTSKADNRKWPIVVPTATNWHQPFGCALIPFLVNVFSGNIQVEGFPDRFEQLQFVPSAESI